MGCGSAHCQFQKSIVPRVTRVPHVPLAVCKSQSSSPCIVLFWRLSKREALVRAQECARTEQARRHFAALPKKMGLCASCREAPAVVQRFSCQRSSEAARRLGADSRSRSNFTARGNHMPPQVLREGFEGGAVNIPKNIFNFFHETVESGFGNANFFPFLAVENILCKSS